jgi:hypothetical protein
MQYNIKRKKVMRGIEKKNIYSGKNPTSSLHYYSQL